ncbi:MULTISPECIES: hypothetical protein [Burkholderiaceae]|uniref:hypothetical protein n=1 Tax=Burkholderiaceae TaxID=119060 RepID=UPI001E656DC7|nr:MULTISPECIES: hypothetical protein [Burkholderiaceae]
MSQVANATIAAAEKAFSFVMDDKGYTEAVWLMTQLAIAAKKNDLYAHLRSVGISLPDDATLPDVTASLTEALDRAVDNSRRRSDLAEIAGRALVGAVADALQPHFNGLFPNDKDTMRAALSKLGTQKEFGDLSRSFFDRLANQSLQYFLSKTLATHVGEGMRFATMNQKALFDHALSTHTWEASVIVRDFSSQWFSKHRYEEGGDISRKSSDGFAGFALKKMKDELKLGARTSAN